MGHLDQYYNKKKEFIDLLGGKCVKCGATENLHFDHINPEDKCFVITANITHKKTLEEIKKCQLLCETCHKAKHSSKHGTISRYCNYNCRCDLCVEALRKYLRERYRKTKKNQDFKPAEHGSYSMYARHKCRCDLCVNNRKEYLREWRKRRKEQGYKVT